tara:strand:+ start:292 stop:876 length:585 start_codon:yes stop_codon:yes gene_type:complete
MKVNIGKYPNRLICRVHTRYMDRKYGYVDWPEPEQQTRFQRSLELFEDAVQSVYNVFNWIWFDRRKQKVKVRIDRQDTWNMDHTLAPIILPMLKQLKQTKHGAPNVDPQDVPKELRPTAKWKKAYEGDGTTDPKFFERWDWVLDEMIYAFDCKASKDDVFMRFDIDDRDGVKAEQERISNGFRLFGKYYESLWD